MTRSRHIAILLGLSVIFFFIGNQLVPLTNPDEVFYAQTAKEMIGHHTWMVPYLFGHPQFEKPILLYWFLRLAFMIFGISSFSARFFPAVFGTIGVIATYLLVSRATADNRKAFICSIVLMSGLLYVGLARTVFTDMIFSVFIYLSLVAFYYGYTGNQKEKQIGIWLFFVFAALATLTKGPLGFAIPIPIVLIFLAIRRDLSFFACREVLFGAVLAVLISFPWYIFMLQRFGHSFIHEFFYNDNIRRLIAAEHASNDTWYFYPGAILLSMFPWTFMTIAAFFPFASCLKKEPREPFYLFVACWMFVVFVLFELAQSKLGSYVFPLFPAVAIVTGSYVHDFLKQKKRKGLTAVLFLNGALISLLPVGMYIASIRYLGALPSYPIELFAIFLSVVMFSMVCLFVFKQWHYWLVFLIVIQMPLFLAGAMHWRQAIGDAISSKAPCEYLLHHTSYVGGPILCSKGNVRGVHYFTQKPVAAVDLYGQGFWSPHPIPFLNTPGELAAYLQKREITWCIVRPKAVRHMRAVLNGNFTVTVLRCFQRQWVVCVRYGRSQSFHMVAGL